MKYSRGLRWNGNRGGGGGLRGKGSVRKFSYCCMNQNSLKIQAFFGIPTYRVERFGFTNNCNQHRKYFRVEE
jgi:hypothetical protein